MANKYSIFCNDENRSIFVWGDTPPTACPSSENHTIDDAKTELVEAYANEMRVRQKQIGGDNPDSYRQFAFYAEVGAHSAVDIPLDFKIDINLFSVHITTSGRCVGDSYDVHVNRDTPIGVVTADSKTSTVHVSPTVVQHAVRGYFVNFNGGTRYMITAVDSGSNTITIDGTVATSAGSVVSITYYMIKDKVIIRDMDERMGNDIIGSVPITTSMIGCVTYRNTSSSIRRVSVCVEATF